MNPSIARLKKRQCLDKMISNQYAESTPSDEFFKNVDFFLGKMADSVSAEIPGFGFDVYGSFTNGFVTEDSDLDISIFPREEIRGRAAIVDHLKRISDVLLRMGVRNSVIEARVPIIKCDGSKFPGIDMDISYDNRLAFCNTRLLNLYCQWEPNRLPQLGIFVKSWAKACDIADASRKFPSSYAWILMLIHYLQNCSPPVLPCLQKPFKSKNRMKIEHWVSGTLYYKVCTTVEKNWSKNKKTTGELFIGFLNYVRQGSRNKLMLVSQLGKGQPEWMKNYGDQMKLLVQDPFVYWESGTIGSRDAAEANHVMKVIDLTMDILNEYDFEDFKDASEFFQSCKFKIIVKATEGGTNEEVQEEDQHSRFSVQSDLARVAQGFGSRPSKPVVTHKYFTQEDCNTREVEEYSRFWPEDRNAPGPIQKPVQRENQPIQNQPGQNQREEPNPFLEVVLPFLITVAKEVSLLDFLLFGFLYYMAPSMEAKNIFCMTCLLIAWLIARAFLLPHNRGQLVQHSRKIGGSLDDVATFLSTPISHSVGEQWSKYSRYFNWFTSSTSPKEANVWTKFDNQWMSATPVSDRQVGRSRM